MKTRYGLWAAALLAVMTLAGCDNTTPEQHFAEAQKLRAENQVRAAVIELKNALQKSPDFGEARALLGKLHFINGDFADAEKELDRAINLGVDDPEVRHYRLRNQLIISGPSEVIGALEEETELTPELAVVLGEAYFIAGDRERAQPLIEQGLHTARGQLAYARMVASDNDLQRALNYVSQAVETDPSLTEAWLHKGEVELALAEGDSGLNAFTQGARLPAGGVRGLMGVVRSHIAQDNLEQAREAVMRLSTQAGGFPPVDYLRGLVLYRTNELDGAEEALRDVQSNAPNHLPTQLLMGIVQAELGRTNQAVALLESYISQVRDDVSARKLLATLRFDRGEPDAALALLLPVVEQAADPQLWAMVGNAQMQVGEAAQATVSLQRAVELAPDMAPFRNQLALSLLNSGMDEEGFAELDNAIALDNDQFQSELIRAMYDLRSGNFAAAAESIDALIAKDPESPLGYNMKGTLMLAQDQQEAGKEMFQKALSLDPAFFPASQNLALLANQDDDAAAAKTVLESAVAANPDSEPAALALIDSLAEQGDLDAALELAIDTVGKHPAAVRPRLAQTRLLMATGQIAAAEGAVRNLLEIYPELTDGLLLLGQIQLSSNDAAGAAATAAQLQSKADDLRNTPSALMMLGEIQLRVGELTLARRNLAPLLEAEEPPSPALALMAELALREQQPQEVEKYLSILSQRNISSERIDLIRGEALALRGDLDGAQRVFQQLYAQGSRQGMMRYAGLLQRTGQVAEAERVLTAWSDKTPDDRGAQVALAGLQLVEGRQNDAKARYEAMLPTNNGVVLNNLAWIYLEEGNDKAESTARLALEALPGNPDVLDTLGWVLVNTGQQVEGLRYLRESARAKPNDPTVQYHLAVGLNRSGETDKARDVLQSLLANDVQFADRQAAADLLNSLD